MSSQQRAIPAAIGGVDDAERFARLQFTHYRSAADALAGERALHTLLGGLSDRANLQAICRDLRARSLYRNYAYRHNLGFYVIFLVDPEIGLQCRLHLWMPDAETRMEKPHRHRMGFASTVLCGELSYLLYARHDLNGTGSVGEDIYHEMCIDAPVTGDFDAPATQLVPRGDVRLEVVSEHTFRAGETYFFRAEGIHRVCTPERFNEPRITLTVWEPPFQASIAYEPLGAYVAAGTAKLPVMRIPDDRYLQLVQTVERSLEEAA